MRAFTRQGAAALSLLLLGLEAPCCLVAAAPAGTTTIHNDKPRLDTDGLPVDSHSGNVVKMGDTYFMYGEHYGTAPWTVTSTTLPRLSVYSSKDLVTWENHVRQQPAPCRRTEEE